MDTTKAEVPASFDLDAILAAGTTEDATFKVGVIFDEDGNAVSGFEIVGRNSEQCRKVEKALSIVNRKASAARSKAIDQKTDAGAEKFLAIIEEQNVARCAAVTVGWFGWDKAGVPRPFDASMMLPILKAKPTWVEKILNALFDDANFLPNLQVTSAPTPTSN